MAADARDSGPGRTGALFLSLTVSPGSRETGVAGRRTDGSFGVTVKAPASESRANKELIAFLAREFGVPRSSVSITTGSGSRRKLVRIEGPELLPEWLGRGDVPGTGCR